MNIELLDEEFRKRILDGIDTVSRLNREIVTGCSALIDEEINKVDSPSLLKAASEELSLRISTLLPNERLRVSLQKTGKSPYFRYYLRFRSLDNTVSYDDVIELADRKDIPDLFIVVRQVLLLNLLQQNWFNFVASYQKITPHLAIANKKLKKEH